MTKETTTIKRELTDKFIFERYYNNPLYLSFREAARTYDGFTMDKTGKIINPSGGYAVGVKSFDSISALCDFINGNSRFYAGFWRDSSDNGKAYFDAVLILNDRKTAIEAGRTFGQIAIYDFSSKSDIAIDNH